MNLLQMLLQLLEKDIANDLTKTSSVITETFLQGPYPTRIKQDQNDFYSMSYAKKKKMHELTEVSHADYSHKSRESKIDDVKQKGKSN